MSYKRIFFLFTLIFGLLFLFMSRVEAYPYCSLGICVTGADCFTGCHYTCLNCTTGYCEQRYDICYVHNYSYRHENCCQYSYGGSCSEDCDCTGTCCTPGCTPSCPSYAPNSSGSYGYVTRYCTDDCGDSDSRKCYCSSACTPTSCPTGTSTTGSYGFYRTYSCTNDCGDSNSRSCYCTSNCTPASCPTGTSESGSYGFYNTYSCTNACGRSQSRSCYCTSNCTPQSCPTGTSESGSYGFYNTYSCTNACGSSQSRSCYCTSNCSLPACPTGTSTTGSYGLYDTYSCSNACGISRSKSCYCTSNCTPRSCPTGTSESGTHGFYATYSCTNACGTSQSRSCNCNSACIPSPCNPDNQHETKQSGIWYGDNDLKSCDNACGEYQSRNCYWVCERATCTDLPSVTVDSVSRHWLDECPAGADCEQVVKDVPITASVYSGCPNSETKTCYYPNIDPAVESVQALDTGEEEKGYTSNSHTGTDLNNPVNVRAVYSDADGVEDIAAIYVWWSTSETKNFVTPNYLGTATPKSANNQNFGFMIRRSRTTNQWDGIYAPYIGSDSRWVRVGTYSTAVTASNPITINGPSADDIANIYDMNIASDTANNTVTLTLTMYFMNPVDGRDMVFTDQYNLWGTVNDQVGFLPFSETDEIWHPDRWVDAGSDWNLDMIEPINLSITNVSTSEGEIKLTVSGEDAGDGMKIVYARLDACREEFAEGGVNPLIVDGDLYSPTEGCSGFEENTRINFSPLLVENSILGASAILPANSTDFTTEKIINLNGNDDGTITFYLTVMDYAGNNHYESLILRLGDWAIVEDALVYGGGGVSSSTRLQEDDNVWPVDTSYPLRKYFSSPISIDLTNQALLAKNEDSLLRELRRDIENFAFKTTNFSGLTIADPYIELIEVHDAKKELLGSAYTDIPVSGTITGPLSSVGADGCITEYCGVKSDGDLIIGPNFVCDSKGLIVSNGNIIINPNFTNDTDSDSCIILANGNITITASGISEGYPTSYDQVEAFLIAKESIIIDSNGDPRKNDYGLAVEGGLTAFDPISGIQNSRVIFHEQKENFPALAIKGKSKYGLLSRILFGTQVDIFYSDVGFKPY